MKQAGCSAHVLRLAICALIIASANKSVNAGERNSSNRSVAIFATSAADGGRLVIQRSPLLGSNVAIYLTMDGKTAGTLVQGHTYDRYITPGRHTLSATPNSSGQAWHGTLEVHAGKTYSYMASFNVSKVVLKPVTGSR